jgi:hypothetical protein
MSEPKATAAHLADIILMRASLHCPNGCFRDNTRWFSARIKPIRAIGSSATRIVQAKASLTLSMAGCVPRIYDANKNRPGWRAA